jgi:dCMP deaminase
MANNEWDRYFMGLAQHVCSKSKDPSTKVGAVVVRPDLTVAAMGYNGFPRGVLDLPERYTDRPTKYSMVVHAEANAIVSAKSDLTNCKIYCTMFPCQECAKLIIQAGITEVIGPPAMDCQRWEESMKVSTTMFREAGVRFRGSGQP